MSKTEEQNSSIDIDEYIELSQKYSKLSENFRVVNNTVRILTFCCGNTVKDKWNASEEKKLENSKRLMEIVELLMRSNLCHISQNPNFEKELVDLQEFSKRFFKEMSEEAFDPTGFNFIRKIINFKP